MTDDAGTDSESGGAQEHFRALERLYAQAPINRLFESRLEIAAAGAVHGTSYFKMLDDAAFYAANSLVSDRFILTTAFNLLFTKPLKSGPVIAEGRWVSGKRRVFVADARLIDSEGDEIARGTGTFMRSHIPLATLPGYRKDD